MRQPVKGQICLTARGMKNEDHQCASQMQQVLIRLPWSSYAPCHSHGFPLQTSVAITVITTASPGVGGYPRAPWMSDQKHLNFNVLTDLWGKYYFSEVEKEIVKRFNSAVLVLKEQEMRVNRNGVTMRNYPRGMLHNTSIAGCGNGSSWSSVTRQWRTWMKGSAEE